MPESAITALAEWVREGAPDPREEPRVAESSKTWEEALKVRRNWWIG